MTLSPEQNQHWQDKGYLLLEGFYTDQEIDQLNNLVDGLWNERSQLDANHVIDIFVESEREQRVYFRDAPDEARHLPYKLNDLFLSSDQVRQMVAGQSMAPILAELLDGVPMICNSLNFEFGSQQDYHFDTFYMPSPTRDKMVASWIALENATETNGPLTYYPGSHKIPPYIFSSGSTIIVNEEMPEFREYMQAQIAERNLQAETLLANKGDVLIWHSQLFHGGSEILDKTQTRKSLVTHYFTHEDFPDSDPPMITEQSCYMARPAQPVGYPFEQPELDEQPEPEQQAEPSKKSWFKRLFGSK